MRRSPLRPLRFAPALLLGIMAWAAKDARAGGHGHAPPHGEAEAEVEIPADLKTRGVKLGEFRIRSHYPVQAQKSIVQFVLHAAVPAEKYAHVDQLVHSNLHKLRDQVIIATRLAPLSVYDEPELESFRRLILVRLRRALPELEFDQLFVSDFQLTVKSL